MSDAQWTLEPFELDCPLCGHPTRVGLEGGDMCPHCGALLDTFDDPTRANQFAETMKAQGENARWEGAENGIAWVVAHKATPFNTMYRRKNA